MDRVIVTGKETVITLCTGRPVYVEERKAGPKGQGQGTIRVKATGTAPLSPLERHELAERMVEAWREWGGLTL